MTEEEYCGKIDGILDQYEVYPEDPRFRIVPSEEPQKSELWYMSFMAGGRPLLRGLYKRRDLYFCGIRVGKDRTEKERNVLYLLENTGLSHIPGVEVRNINLAVDYKSLSERHMVSYTRQDMINALQTLTSKEYGEDTKDDWAAAIVLFIGITSEAVKLIEQKEHVRLGLIITEGMFHFPSPRLLKLQNKWSKLSKAVKTKSYPYKFDYDVDAYGNATGSSSSTDRRTIEVRITSYSAGLTLALINDKDGTKKEKPSKGGIMIKSGRTPPSNPKKQHKEHRKHKREGGDRNPAKLKKLKVGGEKDVASHSISIVGHSVLFSPSLAGSDSCAPSSGVILVGPEKLGSTTTPKVMEKNPETENKTPLKPAAKGDTSSKVDMHNLRPEDIIGTSLEMYLEEFDFSIQYGPPKWATPGSSDSSTSDSSASDSSGSVSCDTETVAEEAQSGKVKNLAGSEKHGSSTSLEVNAEEPEIKDDTLLSEDNTKTLAPVLVKHGSKLLSEGIDKNPKRAKKMETVTEEDQCQKDNTLAASEKVTEEEHEIKDGNPLKSCSDSSAFDTSGSVSAGTETLAEEAQSQKEIMLAGPILVKHGAKSLAEVVDKSSSAKKMDGMDEGETDYGTNNNDQDKGDEEN